MKRYLVTQSLLSAWGYTFDCYEGNEEEARREFLRVLNREPGEATQAMLNGIAFENAVYASAAGQDRPLIDRWESGIQQVAQILQGATFQVRATRGILVDGDIYIVHGVLDALKAGTIYDVKFSSKSFNSVDLPGKYLESPQHPAYFYLVPEAEEFKYLVSDGEEIYIESYRREDTREIGEIIAEFVQSLRMDGLLELYREKWRAM